MVMLMKEPFSIYTLLCRVHVNQNLFFSLFSSFVSSMQVSRGRDETFFSPELHCRYYCNSMHIGSVKQELAVSSQHLSHIVILCIFIYFHPYTYTYTYMPALAIAESKSKVFISVYLSLVVALICVGYQTPELSHNHFAFSFEYTLHSYYTNEMG